uniref:Uncharacterized protein n=1 Tax=Myotis lucifugus TaxID=59463 RepID=G1PRL6_MYOLU
TIFEPIKGSKVLVDAGGHSMAAFENKTLGMFLMAFENKAGLSIEAAAFRLYVSTLSTLGGTWTSGRPSVAGGLCESVKYFLDNLDQICQLNYFPSKQEDILLVRKATKGIVEHDFVIKKIPFEMVDVDSQRSQHQKWFQCFDGITSILFMVSLSECNQGLMEDWPTNWLVEFESIFETIINNKLFFNSIIAFLNKTDLLVEKMRSDPHQLEDLERYLVQCFCRWQEPQNARCSTTAIDGESLFMFHAVTNTILKEILKDIMLQ